MNNDLRIGRVLWGVYKTMAKAMTKCHSENISKNNISLGRSILYRPDCECGDKMSSKPVGGWYFKNCYSKGKIVELINSRQVSTNKVLSLPCHWLNSTDTSKSTTIYGSVYQIFCTSQCKHELKWVVTQWSANYICKRYDHNEYHIVRRFRVIDTFHAM